MLTKVIPSYLYWQYNDDDDLLAFVSSFNGMAQEYVDWFVNIGLPIYTGDMISGELLDWVGNGIYGQARPVLPLGSSSSVGQINTYGYNQLGYNASKQIADSQFYVATDDIYKRVLTWNFYKGDGFVFNVRWLKRRVMRFLLGDNGTDPGISQTYQISVRFNSANNATITILDGRRRILGGAIVDESETNTFYANEVVSTEATETVLENAALMQSAINAGILNLPFDYTYNVVING